MQSPILESYKRYIDIKTQDAEIVNLIFHASKALSGPIILSCFRKVLNILKTNHLPHIYKTPSALLNTSAYFNYVQMYPLPIWIFKRFDQPITVLCYNSK